MKRYRRARLAALLVLLCLITGCQTKNEKEAERTDVSFTVMTIEELPQELSEIIEENKKNEMRLTWTDGTDLYLIRGYGTQKTGGYSVAVAECAEDEETIWFDTRLIGPRSREGLPEDPSYPYLVIKTEASGKNVVIQ